MCRLYNCTAPGGACSPIRPIVFKVIKNAVPRLDWLKMNTPKQTGISIEMYHMTYLMESIV
jgi:hypothetical protein